MEYKKEVCPKHGRVIFLVLTIDEIRGKIEVCQACLQEKVATTKSKKKPLKAMHA